MVDHSDLVVALAFRKIVFHVFIKSIYSIDVVARTHGLILLKKVAVQASEFRKSVKWLGHRSPLKSPRKNRFGTKEKLHLFSPQPKEKYFSSRFVCSISPLPHSNWFPRFRLRRHVHNKCVRNKKNKVGRWRMMRSTSSSSKHPSPGSETDEISLLS